MSNGQDEPDLVLPIRCDREHEAALDLSERISGHVECGKIHRADRARD